MSAPPEPVVQFRIQLTPEALRTVLIVEAILAHEHTVAPIALAFINGNQLKGQQKRLLFRDGFTCCATANAACTPTTSSSGPRAAPMNMTT